MQQFELFSAMLQFALNLFKMKECHLRQHSVNQTVFQPKVHASK